MSVDSFERLPYGVYDATIKKEGKERERREKKRRTARKLPALSTL